MSTMTCTAYYTTRKGGSAVRSIKTAAEAEKLLSGGYGCVTGRIEHNETGEVVGVRERQYGLGDGRRKYFWSYDPDYFTA
jgi:hypothetical protein